MGGGVRGGFKAARFERGHLTVGHPGSTLHTRLGSQKPDSTHHPKRKRKMAHNL